MICLFLLVPEKPGYMEKFTTRSGIPELIDMSSSNRYRETFQVYLIITIDSRVMSFAFKTHFVASRSFLPYLLIISNSVQYDSHIMTSISFLFNPMHISFLFGTCQLGEGDNEVWETRNA